MVEHISSKCKAGFFKNVRNYFREYCECTTIHGFRYFGEKRTVFEKVWWFITFFTCLSACIFSIYVVYMKWDKSPVIVTFATRETPIYQIPFPTVTVCPESKSVQSQFNYTKILHEKIDGLPVSSIDNQYFEYMSLICNRLPSLVRYMNNNTFPETFFDVIDEIKPDLIFMNCTYMGKEESCSSIFTPIITDEGICYTFNMLDRSEIFRKEVVQYADYHKVPYHSSNWTLEYGYTDDAGVRPYPRRALLAGAKNALTFSMVTRKRDLDYACKDSLQGYRVLLHTATHLPRPSQQYFRVPLDQNVVGAIQPVMITTSDAVQMYHPQRRECYFPSERHLRYFRIYSAANCQIECLTNYTLHLCECVNFFMPRENGTKVCGTGRMECMRVAEADVQMSDLKRKLSNKYKKKRKKAKVDCDCLPICTDLTYEVETSQTDWEWEKQHLALRYASNYTRKTRHQSSLTIFFKANLFITCQRNELYGPTDFLANIGGLLELFTGFSVLSLMEIIYFLSVRLICNSRLYGYWAGEHKE